MSFTSPVVQKRNGEMVALASADLLSADDRNVCAEWYSTSAGSVTGTDAVPLPLVRHNFFPEVYDMTAGVLTLYEAGMYFLSWAIGVAHSGSSEFIWTGQLQQYVGGVWTTVDGTPVMVTSFAGWAMVTNSCILHVSADDQFRLLAQSNSGGSPTYVAGANRLSVFRLFKNG